MSQTAIQKKRQFGLTLLIFVISFVSSGCGGIQISPGEIQLFSGAGPVVSVTPTPTETPTTIPTPTLPPIVTPVPANNAIEASAVTEGTASQSPPAEPAPPPISNATNVTIVKYIDNSTVDVMVDGVEYRLPYATLPAPPPQPTHSAVEWDPRLDTLGITLRRANPSYGETVFRLVKAKYKDEWESNGLHHIYVEVLDETGHRILRQPVTQMWDDGFAIGHSEDKPLPEFALNFPMYGEIGNDNYSVYVSGAQSDVVSGLGLPGSHKVNYELTFQRQ